MWIVIEAMGLNEVARVQRIQQREGFNDLFMNKDLKEI